MAVPVKKKLTLGLSVRTTLLMPKKTPRPKTLSPDTSDRMAMRFSEDDLLRIQYLRGRTGISALSELMRFALRRLEQAERALEVQPRIE